MIRHCKISALLVLIALWGAGAQAQHKVSESLWDEEKQPLPKMSEADSLLTARVDSIYRQLPYSDQWMIEYNAHYNESESEHHYVRAAIEEGRAYRRLLQLFGRDIMARYMADDAVADYLARKYAISNLGQDELRAFPLANARKESGAYYLYMCVRRLRINEGSLRSRALLAELENSKEYFSRKYKPFDITNTTAIDALHDYPASCAHLAKKDSLMSRYISRWTHGLSDSLRNTVLREASDLLAEKQRLLGPDHPGCALTLSDMAFFYFSRYRKENYPEAIRLQTEALSIYRKSQCSEAVRLAAQFLSHIYHEQYVYFRKVKYVEYSDYLIPLKWKQQELDVITPVLGSEFPEVIMARREQAYLEEQRQKGAYQAAWAQMNDSCKALSPDRKATLLNEVNRRSRTYMVEKEHHYVRTALMQRQLCNVLADAFGTQICDTLFKYPQYYHEKYRSDKTDDVTYFANEALKYVFSDNSQMAGRARAILESSEGLAGSRHKQFDALAAQPLVIAHQYPRRHARLAAMDDSLAVVIVDNKSSKPYYKDAIAFGEQVLAEKARAIGKRHPCYALTLSDLALLYRLYATADSLDKRFAQAIELQRQAIDIYHRTKQHEAEKLSLQFLSHLYYEWSRFLDLSNDEKRHLVIQHLEQELAMTRPVLGDSAAEVLVAEAQLREANNYLDDLFVKRHEMGDKRFGDAVEMYRRGDYKKALEWFDYLAKNYDKADKFTYLDSRRQYVPQWQAACHLQLGDTAEAARLDTYYRLAPVDRRKTVEIDYQLRYGGNYGLAIALARDSMSEGTPEHARLLLHIYQQLIDNKQYTHAAQALSKAKPVVLTLLGGDDPAYADLLTKLGKIYAGIGYHQEAMMTFEESAAIVERAKGKQDQQYLNIAILIEIVAKECNDTRRLARWTRERLDNDTITEHEWRIEVMKSFVNTIAQDSKADSTATLLAIDYAKLCIANYQRKAYACKPERLSADTIGNMYYYLNQTDEALKYTYYMAGFYKRIGHTDELKSMEEQCTAWMRDSILWRPGNEWRPSNDKNISEHHFALGRLYWCYMHLGQTFDEIGNYEKSLEAFELARQVLHERQYRVWLTSREGAPLYDATNYIADIYKSMILSRLDRHEESVQTILAARRLREEMDGGRKRMYFQVAGWLTKGLNRLGRHAEAAEALAEWWDYRADYVLRQLVVLNPQQRELLWNREKNFFEQLVTRGAMETGTPKLWTTLYDNALLTKGLLLNTELEIERAITESADTMQAARYQQLKQSQLLLMGELQKAKHNRTVDTDSLQAYIRTQTYDLMQAMQQSEGNGIASRLRTRWQDVQKRLGKNDVAVEFVVFPMKNDSLVYAALTLRRGYERPRLTTLCTLSDLKALEVADYYGSSRLYDMLWRPLESELKGAQNVFFAPIGKLHQIAIEYLPGMEQYNTYRLTSTRELLHPATSTGTQRLQAALYGGLKYELTAKERTAMTAQAGSGKSQTAFRDVPDLTELRDLRGAAKRMPVLEGTLREVEDIDSLMRTHRVSATKATGTEGTEESFKALSGQHKALIHVSTHGFYQPEQPQTVTEDDDDMQDMLGSSRQAQTQEDRSLSRSGLLMTGAADYLFGRVSDLDSDDGILTAREISRLDLRGLDLVVLSACETGLGDISGEGVFGLQRGFKKAGAQTLLVSLWKVDDDATQLLMTEFYRGLLSGKTKRQAFLDAQQALRRAEGGRFDRYECWAAFVMIDAI